MSELRKTPEGKEKHCADERNRMSESRKTPEEKEKMHMKEVKCKNYSKLQKEKT